MWYTTTSRENDKDSDSGDDSAPYTPDSLDLDPAEHDDEVSDIAPDVPALSELETGISLCVLLLHCITFVHSFVES